MRQFPVADRGIEIVAEAGDGQEARRLICAHLPRVAVVDVGLFLVPMSMRI